jgi:serine/threonine-protein kinase
MFTPVMAQAGEANGPPAGVAGLGPDVVVAGRYRLLRYLAAGGMAEVWLAEHQDLRTEVAIKFVHARIATDATVGPLALDRFRLEAQVSAKLAGVTRHVVAVHDAGLHEGVPYLVMEYVQGRTLEEEVEALGAIPPERLCGLLAQIADALDAAHAAASSTATSSRRT